MAQYIGTSAILNTCRAVVGSTVWQVGFVKSSLYHGAKTFDECVDLCLQTYIYMYIYVCTHIRIYLIRCKYVYIYVCV